MGVHVPVEHELHSPHAVLQQMPDTQFPFLHWLGAEQTAPLSFLGVHVPEVQLFPEAQSASEVQLVLQAEAEAQARAFGQGVAGEAAHW